MRAEKYLRKVADAGFGDAVYANALLEEAALNCYRPRGRLLNLNGRGETIMRTTILREIQNELRRQWDEQMWNREREK